MMLIVFIDAIDLRKKISLHAKYINQLAEKENTVLLREQTGHTFIEAAAGIVLGLLIGYLLFLLM